ncbi:MAG: HAD hydrolase family protein [Chloroflexota bacterium]|nr:HAD hydrolase family protein [Chloroflexota bacterium]
MAILIIPVKKLEAIKAISFDFDGVFTDNRVYVLENGEEAVACNRSDGLGISMLNARGVPLVIISTEKNPVVAARGGKLNLEVIQGVNDKLPKLVDWAGENGLSLDQIAFLGNDINDVQCLKRAGLGVAVSDAYPIALEAADFVLTKKGGRGAVREIADLWLASNPESTN